MTDPYVANPVTIVICYFPERENQELQLLSRRRKVTGAFVLLRRSLPRGCCYFGRQRHGGWGALHRPLLLQREKMCGYFSKLAAQSNEVTKVTGFPASPWPSGLASAAASAWKICNSGLLVPRRPPTRTRPNDEQVRNCREADEALLRLQPREAGHGVLRDGDNRRSPFAALP